MAKEAEIGVKLGYLSKEKYEGILSLLKEAGLPVLIPQNIDINKAIELIKKDKKGSLVFAFSEKDYNVCVDETKLRQFLRCC
jgi:3-dehydroquinate synthetase